jgi:hypothetical protein
MLPAPKRKEIDHRTMKLIVGIIATSLAYLTGRLAGSPIESISASYYEGGWSQTIFIGFLFAIAAFLAAYNGQSRTDMILSKVAAAAGLGIALFPCKCGIHVERLPYVHGVSAAVMFLVLVYFCYAFYTMAKAKRQMQAKARAGIYALCGVAILLSIVVLAIDNIAGGALGARIPRLTYYGEATGLVSFGISWLTASRTLPVLTSREERFSPLREDNPP